MQTRIWHRIRGPIRPIGNLPRNVAEGARIPPGRSAPETEGADRDDVVADAIAVRQLELDGEIDGEGPGRVPDEGTGVEADVEDCCRRTFHGGNDQKRR